MVQVPSDASKDATKTVPLTCHGHSRPVPHISFSSMAPKDGQYYLISACKDGNPMLRDGITGDWIGTFIGHKGAVWQARLSHDISVAATASADFTAKVWDTYTGECRHTLQHNHIVRAVAFPPDNSDLIATGGAEKMLRIFDLSESKAIPDADGVMVIQADSGFEIGAGVHTNHIKFIVWTHDHNTVVTASGNTLRWFDLPGLRVIKQEVLDGEIGSCDLFAPAPDFANPSSDLGGDHPVLAVAAGKSVYFWGGQQSMDELKRVKLPYTAASVGVDVKNHKYIVGEDIPATWARVYNWDDDSGVDVHKGHHGPVWCIAFSPDDMLYATASEDGTIKLWKNCEGAYGLWKSGSTNGVHGSGEGTPAE